MFKIPFNCQADAFAKALTAGIGEYLEIDEGILGLDRFHRIKLMLDVRIPVKQSQSLRDKRGRMLK